MKYYTNLLLSLGVLLTALTYKCHGNNRMTYEPKVQLESTCGRLWHTVYYKSKTYPGANCTSEGFHVNTCTGLCPSYELPVFLTEKHPTQIERFFVRHCGCCEPVSHTVNETLIEFNCGGRKFHELHAVPVSVECTCKKC